MIDSLFGVDLPLPVKLVVAFVVVLVLIALATWIFRRFGGATRVGATSSRSRQPRLAVIDAAPVDARRRLVLIRRDNVEHLVMIGGPTDVVVEQNIVRAVPVNQPRDGSGPRAEMTRPTALPEPPPPRVPQEARATTSDFPPPRPRAEPRMSPEPRPPEPRMSRPEPRPEQMPRPVPARSDVPRRMPPPMMAREPVELHPEPPTSDPNLVDMASKLEAALRPANGRRAEPEAPALPAPAADAAPARRAPPPPPQQQAATAPALPAENKAGASRSVFDSLEEEMASLLGKPPSKP